MSQVEPEALSPLKRALIEIRELKARQAAADRRVHEPIAIVGMGMRYPGGVVDAESFWNLLWDGVDAIGEVPPERWPADDLYDPDPDVPGKMNTRWGGFLDHIEAFDAPFFGISPREAESMDPQQRLLLEVTWEALEDAGVAADGLFGGNTGVFVGIANSDYMRMLLADRQQIDTYTTTGNALSVAAGRLAYQLGVQGPAIALDTACSSSLVAVHLAAQSLRAGECDLAVSGGVNLILTPELTINFSRARMMAADGRCKTFDAAADGYVRSEGCAMVALKRLSDAQRDGDRVLAVIRGSAVNQDGRSGGLTAPNGPSQESVIASALDNAGVAHHDVSYVEAHGTGTLLGDPIEVGSLGGVLCRDRPADRPLLLGSVKTNIGHTESAAGVAGLIKLALMLQHGAIPPHLHLDELNPHIAAEGLPIAVPTERTAWPERAGGRLAGVSSFGLSGTNAHVIVGEAPASDTTDATDLRGDDRSTNVLALSARSDAALGALAGRLADRLDGATDLMLGDVAHSANTGRSHLERRLAVLAGDRGGAVRQLRAFVDGEPAADAAETYVTSPADAVAPGGLAFLFTGHGSHYAAMGSALYADEPVFAAAIDRCAALLVDELDRGLTEILFDDGALLDRMEYAQPGLFCLQYALTELWASWGLRPTIVAGHSAGEYVAAVVAGVVSLSDGLRVIAARGRLMQSLPADGEMVALFTDEATVAGAVESRSDDVGIAAVNGPFTTVISGRRGAVQEVIDELALDDDDLRRLDVSVAAHSPLVEPILDDFAATVAGVELSAPQIGLVSSMTGRFVVSEPTEVGYWRRHLRQPVRFADVFDTLREAGCTTFVEIGPHPTLLGLGRRAWPDSAASWIPSMQRGSDELAQIAHSAASVYAAGHAIDWRSFDRHGRDDPPARRKVPLPTYPWQRSSYWSPAATQAGPAPAAPMWAAAAAAAALQADSGPLDLDVDSYPQRFELLERLAGAYIARAFRSMGLFTQAGEAHRVDELFDAGHIGETAMPFAEGYEHLAGRWLEHLVDDGLLTTDGDRFVSSTPLPDVDVESIVAEAEIAFEGIEPLLDYVRRCGDDLDAVVTGRETALNTLFPEGSYETVDFVYGGWAIPRYFNAIVRAAATAAANSRPGRPLRVLEIGAGTGGTTAAVLPALPADRTSYTFTDVSDFFLARAAERFAAHPTVSYALLDIEDPPAAQGFEPSSYDIVVAANVLHATKNLDVTLRHVRSLLAPGGVLLAYEGTHHPRWFDVTTGLIEGWQLFEDDWRDDVPLISPQRWSEALLASDFSDVAALPAEDAPTSALLHNVLVARASGDDVVSVRPRLTTHAAGMPDAEGSEVATVSFAAAPPDVAALLDAAMPDERHDVVVDVVRQAIALVLRIADHTTLRRDQPLLDLGFDSLMAVELRNVLRQWLALDQKIPATVVFDHPTIDAVASYLEPLLPGAAIAAGAADETRSGRRGATDADARQALGEAAVAELSADEVEAALLRKLAEIEK